jgi:DNA-binding transcriptional LysR family regulator
MNRSVPINLAAVDLNLLVAFEALLAEGSVSRAGHRIGLAQSSMSNALARLRLLFKDELFVRTPRGMRPTSRALGLGPAVGEALRHVRSAFAQGARFVPETDQRLFRIGFGQHADFALGVPVVRLLRERAPGIMVNAVPVNSESAVQMLDDGELDLVIAAFLQWPKRIRSTGLYTERFVSVARSGHPGFAKRRPSRREFLELPHLRVSLSGSRNLFDGALADQNLRRRVVITVPNFALVPYVVQSTDLVAVVGERIARHFAEGMGLAVHPIPFHVEPCAMRMYWTAHADNDPANVWLRERHQEIGASLNAEQSGKSRARATANPGQRAAR